MATTAGNLALVKEQSSAVAFTGEATSSSDDTTYQVTDTAKQVFEYDSTVEVFVFDADDAAEEGTTTTNITMTAHGLVSGDIIINTTRSSVVRVVTLVDVDNVTVTAVTSQTSTDVIKKYNKEADANTTKSRLEGSITFSSALARTVLISGSYVTLVTIVEGKSFTFDATTEMSDITVFQDTVRNYTPILQSATASIGKFYSVDNFFLLMLQNKEIKVLEFYDNSSSSTPFRCYAAVSDDSLNITTEGIQEETINFVMTDAMVIGG